MVIAWRLRGDCVLSWADCAGSHSADSCAVAAVARFAQDAFPGRLAGAGSSHTVLFGGDNFAVGGAGFKRGGGLSGSRSRSRRLRGHLALR